MAFWWRSPLAPQELPRDRRDLPRPRRLSSSALTASPRSSTPQGCGWVAELELPDPSWTLREREQPGGGVPAAPLEGEVKCWWDQERPRSGECRVSGDGRPQCRARVGAARGGGGGHPAPPSSPRTVTVTLTQLPRGCPQWTLPSDRGSHSSGGHFLGDQSGPLPGQGRDYAPGQGRKLCPLSVCCSGLVPHRPGDCRATLDAASFPCRACDQAWPRGGLLPAEAPVTWGPLTACAQPVAHHDGGGLGFLGPLLRSPRDGAACLRDLSDPRCLSSRIVGGTLFGAARSVVLCSGCPGVLGCEPGLEASPATLGSSGAPLSLSLLSGRWGVEVTVFPGAIVNMVISREAAPAPPRDDRAVVIAVLTLPVPSLWPLPPPPGLLVPRPETLGLEHGPGLLQPRGPCLLLGILAVEVGLSLLPPLPEAAHGVGGPGSLSPGVFPASQEPEGGSRPGWAVLPRLGDTAGGTVLCVHPVPGQRPCAGTSGEVRALSPAPGLALGAALSSSSSQSPLGSYPRSPSRPGPWADAAGTGLARGPDPCCPGPAWGSPAPQWSRGRHEGFSVWLCLWGLFRENGRSLRLCLCVSGRPAPKLLSLEFCVGVSCSQTGKSASDRRCVMREFVFAVQNGALS